MHIAVQQGQQGQLLQDSSRRALQKQYSMAALG
jgi:hypothetical protein